jgi:UPF0271 protein
MKPADIEYMVAYQIGALQAMAAYAGLQVTHLKTHGRSAIWATEDEGLRHGDRPRHQGRRPRLDLRRTTRQPRLEKAALKLGLRLAREGFPDRNYGDDGNLGTAQYERRGDQGP